MQLSMELEIINQIIFNIRGDRIILDFHSMIFTPFAFTEQEVFSALKLLSVFFTTCNTCVSLDNLLNISEKLFDLM